MTAEDFNFTVMGLDRYFNFTVMGLDRYFNFTVTDSDDPVFWFGRQDVEDLDVGIGRELFHLAGHFLTE